MADARRHAQGPARERSDRARRRGRDRRGHPSPLHPLHHARRAPAAGPPPGPAPRRSHRSGGGLRGSGQARPARRRASDRADGIRGRRGGSGTPRHPRADRSRAFRGARPRCAVVGTRDAGAGVRSAAMSASGRAIGKPPRGSRIADVRATTVTVPLEAPLRHAAGAHWGRFVRTIVEIETESGVVGLGEMGGGGQSAQLTVESLRPKLLGHDVFNATALWFKVLNPTAALYDNRTQIHAALEFACLDAAGRILEVPVYDLLGGKMRDAIPFASYLFFRYPDPTSGTGEVRTIDQLVEHARDLKSRYGFGAHKLKAGVFPPDYELRCFLALAETFPDDALRIDPNASYSVRDAIRVGHAIKGLRNDYYEDPTWGMNGLRQVRQAVGLPIATNTVVTNLEQLAANVRDPAVDVVLLDTTFWGGIRPVLKAAGV